MLESRDIEFRTQLYFESTRVSHNASNARTHRMILNTFVFKSMCSEPVPSIFPPSPLFVN